MVLDYSGIFRSIDGDIGLFIWRIDWGNGYWSFYEVKINYFFCILV